MADAIFDVGSDFGAQFAWMEIPHLSVGAPEREERIQLLLPQPDAKKLGSFPRPVAGAQLIPKVLIVPIKGMGPKQTG